jgi:chemotaxis protein methyltransferase CheR
VKNVDPELLRRYFTSVAAEEAPGRALPRGQYYQVNADLRAHVSFSAHNLLADRFGICYDLICCRNVVIYFTEEAKDRLFQRFYQALSPGGVLLVGGSERIFHYREIGFDSPLPNFYRRPGKRD